MDDNSVGFSASESATVPLAKADPFDRPGVPANARANLDRLNADKPLAQLHGDTSAILERLQAGESALQVAASFGISHVALYRWLLRNSPDEWMGLTAGKALVRLEKAQDALDDAKDQVTISRAREAARLAQWDLERSCRKLYGDNKSETGVVVHVTIDRNAGGGVTIDGQASEA